MNDQDLRVQDPAIPEDHSNAIALVTSAIRAATGALKLDMNGDRKELIAVLLENGYDLLERKLDILFTIPTLKIIAYSLGITKPPTNKPQLCKAILVANKEQESREQLIQKYPEIMEKLNKLEKKVRKKKKKGRTDKKTDEETSSSEEDPDDQVPRSRRALNSPPTCDLEDLETIESRSSVEVWWNSVLSSTKIFGYNRQFESLVLGDAKSPGPEKDAIEKELAEHPKHSQFMECLGKAMKQSLYTSLKETVMDSILSKELQDRADIIGVWVLKRAGALDSARFERSRKKLIGHHWRKSRCSLVMWHTELCGMITKICPFAHPPGGARVNLMRQLILKNVGTESPRIKQLVNSYKLINISHPSCQEPDGEYSNTALVTALQGIMDDEHNGVGVEVHSQTYGAWIIDDNSSSSFFSSGREPEPSATKPKQPKQPKATKAQKKEKATRKRSRDRAERAIHASYQAQVHDNSSPPPYSPNYDPFFEDGTSAYYGGGGYNNGNSWSGGYNNTNPPIQRPPYVPNNGGGNNSNNGTAKEEAQSKKEGGKWCHKCARYYKNISHDKFREKVDNGCITSHWDSTCKRVKKQKGGGKGASKKGGHKKPFDKNRKGKGKGGKGKKGRG